MEATLRTAVAIAVLLLTLFVASASASEGRVQGAVVLWYGVFQPGRTVEVEDKDAPTGKRMVTSSVVPPSVNSERISVTIGVRFGFGYMLIGSPAGAKVQVRHVRKFPPEGFHDPRTGQKLASTTRDHNFEIGRELYIGYGFGEPWEMVPGTWTFELWHGDRKLAEKSFVA
jgi:hypothetical protein